MSFKDNLNEPLLFSEVCNRSDFNTFFSKSMSSVTHANCHNDEIISHCGNSRDVRMFDNNF